MKKLFFIILFLCSLTAYCQNRKPLNGQARVDSLLNEIPAQKDDSNKVKLLNSISHAYVGISNNEMMKYSREALVLAKNLDWQSGIAQSYRYIGHSYSMLSDYNSALENYSIALNLFQELKDKKGIITIYGLTSFAYYRQSKYPLAIDYSIKALKIGEELGDKLNIGTNLRYIGNIYSRQKDYIKAEEYFQKALKIYQELSDTNNMAYIYGNLGETYRNQNKYTEALDYDNRAIKIYEQISYKPGIANNLGNIGEVYKMQGNYEIAISFTLRALKIAEEIDDKASKGIFLGNIGENYFGMAKDTTNTLYAGNKKENVQKAIQYLNEAITILKKINAYDPEIEFSKYLAEAYRITGDYKQALTLTDHYQALKDSIFSAENTATINASEKKYYLDIKDKDLSIAQIKLKNQRTATAFYTIGLVLLLGVVMVILRNNRTQKKLNETISKLVNEQEKVIEQRTSALAYANKKLIELIQYSAHNLREPLTRILGAMLIKGDIPEEEFNGEIWPQMQKAANDLDIIIKEIIDRADKTIG